MFVVASGALGCAADEDTTNVRIVQPPETTMPPSTELRFEEKGSLDLAPGEKQTITVTADPPGAHAVSFALIGDALDARLDRVKAITDDEGRASVELRTSNKPATFGVRAWIEDGPWAEISVSVSGDGFGQLRILPQYEGNREITSWSACVVARTNCAALSPDMPEDTLCDYLGSAPADEPIHMNLPVGPTLAVAVRAGHFAWGCTDEDDLLANGEVTAKVPIIDKPLDLRATDLAITLDVTAPEQPYQNILAAGRDALAGGFLPEGSADAAPLLLDAMAAAQPSAFDAQVFADARLAGGWDALAAAHLEALPVPLRAQLDAWMLTAAAEPLTLRGRLRTEGAPAGRAFFQPLGLGVVEAATAGIPNEYLVTWTGLPGDKVHLVANLLWVPSRYMGGLCRAAALTDAAEGVTMADALATAADCKGLADVLGSSGACDGACLAGLCKDALGARWATAIDVSAAAWQVGEIEVFAAGKAKVDDRAAPLSFEGSWLGSLSDGQIVAKIDEAPVKGELPPPEPPP